MHVQIAWQIYQHQQRTKVSPTRLSCPPALWCSHVCARVSEPLRCLLLAPCPGAGLGWAVGSELGRTQHHGLWGAQGQGPLVGGATRPLGVTLWVGQPWAPGLVPPMSVQPSLWASGPAPYVSPQAFIEHLLCA